MAHQQPGSPSDIALLEKKAPRQYEIVAYVDSVPKIGTVWKLNKLSLSSVLNGYQYSIRSQSGYIAASQYPAGSYLLINSQTGKFTVVKSILLTYAKDRIIAHRKSLGNVPVWELIDKEYIKKYQDIQFSLHFESYFYSDCYEADSLIMKHQVVKRFTPANRQFKPMTPRQEPSFNKIMVQRYSQTNGISLFKRYFELDEKVLNFINVPKIERDKMPNTNFYEIQAVGHILNALEREEYAIDKEVAIVTLFEEQKHILADFFGERIGHESSRPKIGLPSEMRDRRYPVVILSFVIASKKDKHSVIEANEHHIRTIMEYAKEGMLFLGNYKVISSLLGFPKELCSLIKNLKSVSAVHEWSHSHDLNQEIMEMWKAPIRKINPDSTSDSMQKIIWTKYRTTIESEHQRGSVLGMKHVYKDYLYSLGIGKKKKV